MAKQCFGKSHVPISPAVRAGDFVFVSGQVPTDANGVVIGDTITDQTNQVLDNVRSALALAGCSMEDVVKTNVWLIDASDFADFNAAYATHFPDGPPARSTVASGLMIDVKIEIEAIAYKPL